MSHSGRFAVVVLSFVFVSVGALGDVKMDEDGFTSFDSVDTGDTETLDEVDTGHTETLNSVDTGQTETLDSVDTGQTETLNSVDDGRTETLNSVDVGKTQSLEAAEAETGKWEPPACGSFPVALGEMPEGSDPDAWSDTLRDAKQDLRTAKYELDRADRAYTRANNNNSVGVYRERAVQGRKDARENYSQLRCRLPELVEHARRAGVPAGRLRPYEKSPASRY